MEEFVKQQQRNLLPRRRVPVFSGDPLHYCAFIRAFETVIETRELEELVSGQPWRPVVHFTALTICGF